MPHKRNPHASERVAGLARLLRGYAVAGFENVALWHERDISHSSAERVIFPDACIVSDYLLDQVADLVGNLVVHADRMRANVDLTGGLVFSQRVMLALVDHGMDRQDAYKLVQDAAMKTWAVKHDGRDDADFLEVLQSEPAVAKHFKKGELEKLCSLEFHYKEVKSRFRKLGLG